MVGTPHPIAAPTVPGMAAVGRWAWVWLPALAAVVVFTVARDSLIDDAYITLGYARTLAEHGQWGLVPGIPSNTQTSPLNVLLVAALAIPTGSALVAAGVVWTSSVVAVGGFTGLPAGPVIPAALGITNLALAGLGIAGIVPGVLGLWLESAVAMLATYIAGCALGALARMDARVRPHDPPTS